MSVWYPTHSSGVWETQRAEIHSEQTISHFLGPKNLSLTGGPDRYIPYSRLHCYERAKYYPQNAGPANNEVDTYRKTRVAFIVSVFGPRSV